MLGSLIGAREVFGVGVAMLAALVVVGVGIQPVWAADGEVEQGMGVSDTVDMGGGLSARVDTRTGGLSVGLGGVLGASWDSSAAGVNAYGFGNGVGLSVARVDVSGGGMRVVTPSGGVYEADAGEASGLARYKGHDVSFSQVGGGLPARKSVEGREFESSLEGLGGQTTYFDAHGLNVAQTDAHGNRIDWVFQDGVLDRVVDVDGLMTRIDSSTPGEVRVDSPQRSDGTVASVKFGVKDGQLSRVEDPVGGVVQLEYRRDTNLLEGVVSPTGLQTVIRWDTIPYSDTIWYVAGIETVDSRTGDTVTKRTFDPDPVGMVTVSRVLPFLVVPLSCSMRVGIIRM